MNTSTSIVVGPGCSPPQAEQELLPVNASLENPAISLDDPRIWDILSDGVTSEAGVRVNEHRAMTLGLVFQAVSMISADVARLPLNVYVRLADGSCRKDPGHPADRVMSRIASPSLHAKQMWRRMMCFALLWNHAYAYIVRDGAGRVRELVPLLPDRTVSHWDGSQMAYQTVITMDGEEQFLFDLDPYQVLHLEGPSIECSQDERQGEFLHYAREALGLAIAQRGFKSKFFKRGGRIGGVLQLPPGLDKPQQDKIEEGFRQSYQSTDAAFRVVLLRDGAAFHKGQMSFDETQMTEAEADIGREVARWFNLAPSRLGVPESQSYNSKSEDNQAYYGQTLAPWTETVIVPECEMKLLTSEEFGSGRRYVKHDTWALLSMNPLDRMKMYHMGRVTGHYSPNETRMLEGLPRRTDPGGDSYDNPNTSRPGRSTQGGENDNVAAHRELFVDRLAGTLKVVGDKVCKACKSTESLRSHAQGKLLANLKAPAEVAAQVANLRDGENWGLAIFADLVELIQPRLEKISSSGDLAAAVTEVFNDVTTQGVNAIADRIYGSKT